MKTSSVNRLQRIFGRGLQDRMLNRFPRLFNFHSQPVAHNGFKAGEQKEDRQVVQSLQAHHRRGGQRWPFKIPENIVFAEIVIPGQLIPVAIRQSPDDFQEFLRFVIPGPSFIERRHSSILNTAASNAALLRGWER